MSPALILPPGGRGPGDVDLVCYCRNSLQAMMMFSTVGELVRKSECSAIL